MYDSEEGKGDQAQNSYSQGMGTLTSTHPQAPTQDQDLAMQMNALCVRVNSGGSWFYWIAGLSLVNTIAVLLGSPFIFVLGLGITEAITEIASGVGGMAALIGFFINLFVAGIYAGLGYCATHRMKWAFIVGIVFFVLDTLLLLIVKDILSIIFHAYALLCISMGLKAAYELSALERHAKMLERKARLGY